MDKKTVILPTLEINTWTKEPLSALTEKILSKAPRPLILIDGIAGSGKTTLAEKLADKLKANLVHTDDVSWCADPVHWDEEILSGIINPWLNGDDVFYKPSGWMKENRSGSINVDPNKALIIEGMGAARKTLRTSAACSIWVDIASEIARSRVVQRDLANEENGETLESITEFADWWDSLLLPLLLKEESWKYADVIVNGMQSDLISSEPIIYISGF